MLLHEYGDTLTSQQTENAQKSEHKITSTSYIAIGIAVVIAIAIIVLVATLIHNHRTTVGKKKATRREQSFQNVAYSKVNTPRPIKY